MIFEKGNSHAFFCNQMQADDVFQKEMDDTPPYYVCQTRDVCSKDKRYLHTSSTCKYVHLEAEKKLQELARSKPIQYKFNGRATFAQAFLMVEKIDNAHCNKEVG